VKIKQGFASKNRKFEINFALKTKSSNLNLVIGIFMQFLVMNSKILF